MSGESPVPLLPPIPGAPDVPSVNGLCQSLATKPHLRAVLVPPGFESELSAGQCSSGAQVSSGAQACLTLCDPMDCSTPGLPVHHQLPGSLKFMSVESVMPSSHLILCRPILLPPSIFPSIRVFSNESALRIRWPKYWSFSFSISPSSERTPRTDLL